MKAILMNPEPKLIQIPEAMSILQLPRPCHLDNISECNPNDIKALSSFPKIDTYYGFYALFSGFVYRQDGIYIYSVSSNLDETKRLIEHYVSKIMTLFNTSVSEFCGLPSLSLVIELERLH